MLKVDLLLLFDALLVSMKSVLSFCLTLALEIKCFDKKEDCLHCQNLVFNCYYKRSRVDKVSEIRAKKKQQQKQQQISFTSEQHLQKIPQLITTQENPLAPIDFEEMSIDWPADLHMPLTQETYSYDGSIKIFGNIYNVGHTTEFATIESSALSPTLDLILGIVKRTVAELTELVHCQQASCSFSCTALFSVVMCQIIGLLEAGCAGFLFDAGGRDRQQAPMICRTGWAFGAFEVQVDEQRSWQVHIIIK